MVSSAIHSAMQWFNGWNKQDWFIALIVVVVIGVFCLKGFGSRAQY